MGMMDRPYTAAYDCASFAAEVQDKVFGRTLSVPARSNQTSIQILRAAKGFKRTVTPVHGDLVIMKTLKRTWHIGVYIEFPGSLPQILHNTVSGVQAGDRDNMIGYTDVTYYQFIEETLRNDNRPCT